MGDYMIVNIVSAIPATIITNFGYSNSGFSTCYFRPQGAGVVVGFSEDSTNVNDQVQWVLLKGDSKYTVDPSCLIIHMKGFSVNGYRSKQNS